MLNVSSSTSLVVQGVLWALVVFSVVTWTLLLVKGVQNLRASNQNKKYKSAFWSASSLLAASEVTEFNGPTSRVATAGFNALRDADNHESHDLEHSGDRQDLLERTLRQQIQKERRSLETGLAVLASIGSTSPFVGLFGTVWGIMHALTDISKLGSASLEVVAGPIGEALIATGFGIAVAVPAVLAYNFFLRRLKTTTGDLDDFAADLINLSRKVSFRGKTESVSSKAANSDAHGNHANNPSSVVNLKKEAYA